MPSSRARFIGRKEYFGSLIYDKDRGDYIPFDWDATYIFEESKKRSQKEIFKKLNGKITEQGFQTFIQLCQSIELMDKEGKFLGEILSSPAVPQILSAPLKVHLCITKECPLKCRHCSQESRDPAPDELSLKDIQKLIDELASIGTFEISLGGGDPFMRKDLPEIVAYARNAGISVSISSTGLFIGKPAAKKLSEYGIKSFKISFDGSTEKTYDYIRGKGTYRRAMRGLKILREVFPEVPITLHSVLMKSNINEITSLLRNAQKLQCNIWSIDFVKPAGSAKSNPQIHLTPKEAAEAIEYIRKLAENSSIKIEMPQFPYKSTKKGIYRGFGCVGGNLYCYIDSSGNAAPCSFLMEHYTSGNIKKTSLKNIWLKGEGFQKIRALAGNETCLRCDFYNTCRGGCRARAVKSGNPNSVDPCCFLQFAVPVQTAPAPSL